MPLSGQTQDDFSGGMYRGRRAPANAAYDIVNGLIDDEGQLFKRASSAYFSASDAASSLYRLHALYMRAADGYRYLARRVGSFDVTVFNGSLAPVEVSSSVLYLGRPVTVGDYAIFPAGTRTALYYGGSQLSAIYATGGVTLTNGSTSVTGTGTAWLANADPGIILNHTGSGTRAVVKSITNDTALLLASPWTGPTVAGVSYQMEPNSGRAINAATIGTAAGTPTYMAAAGSGTPRLLFCVNNRVYFSPPGDPFSFASDDYHQIAADTIIIGAEGMGDAALIFTTRGVWRISNLSFDAVDAYGNIQHIVEQVNKDLVLWDDFGIAAWDRGLIVPAVDDVYLFSASGEVRPISAAIRPLYRAYVKAGYQPGQAAVHRGHYMLPILNGTTLVDTLVCRVDREPFPWTRWAGHASGGAYAVVVEKAVRQPKILGISGARVTDITGCFDPGASTDADGTNSDFSLTTRDYPTGASQPGVAHKIRARYELASSGVATVAVAYSSDQDAGSFTTLTSRGGQNGTAGWSDSDGSLYQWANVGKKRERIRFKLTVAGACTRFVLRSVELLTRPSGKQ